MPQPAEAMLFYSQSDNPQAWREAMARVLPGIELRIFPEIGDPEDIRFALVWKPPAGFFAPLRRLELVVNLGAGVDTLVGRDDLPDLPITRLHDPDMARMMSSFVQMAVLRHARDIPQFERAQRDGRWLYLHPRAVESITVGVLGLGVLGGRAAADLARHGFSVQGWSSTPKTIAGVACSAGLPTLDAFLARCDILVVMLPLTPQTRGLLSAARLAKLPKGAVFINVARGAVVEEPALIAALQSGAIGEATLDVFATEPLPPGHPFFAMDTVLITPHLASVALPDSAAGEIAANITRLRAGQPVLHRIDPARGY